MQSPIQSLAPTLPVEGAFPKAQPGDRAGRVPSAGEARSEGLDEHLGHLPGTPAGAWGSDPRLRLTSAPHSTTMGPR